MELRPIKTGSITWQVSVTDEGRFYASAPHMPEVSAKSYEELGAACKVRASQSRVKVAVRFAHLNGREYSEGTATGIHAQNGKILARDERSKPYQVDAYTSNYYQPFSAEDKALWLEITAKEVQLYKERKAIEGRYKFPDGFSKTVRQAVDSAVQAELVEREQEAQAGDA